MEGLKVELAVFKLEDLTPGTVLRGIIPDSQVTVVSIKWFGSEALELTYKAHDGRVDNRLLYRDDEANLQVVDKGRPWSFDGDGASFRLVSEAMRIRLAHLFDPVLAVHTSLVEPLPHQITAVYEHMLPRQPLRFLLADDPGAGKTIMAGLLIKELIARGDLQRCLIVCPGSLAEQWMDELYRRFHLQFDILTNDKLNTTRTGNWFFENDLAIVRLDKLSRDEELQEKLKAPDCGWDLVVCDEAHKMSATVFGAETKYTKRYRLGQLLSSVSRHFLLMSATPHNGKEQDFQLFMALLDGDRFEGRFRDGVHTSDVSDMMRRMVKEELLKFDGKPLFPERIAHTVPYKLSKAENDLYEEVTEYVRQEFDRAAKLEKDNKRAGTVGFALTILQRRLASSPEAIYQSLRRRRERLESWLRELELLQRSGQLSTFSAVSYDEEDLADLEDAPEAEWEAAEEAIADQATAARSLEELRLEIGTLQHLEALALSVVRSGQDTKWKELGSLLHEIFGPDGFIAREKSVPYGAGELASHNPSPSQKLVIFTEHRDTLNYLQKRITTVLGSEEAVVAIHGGVGREERLKVQAAFRHDVTVKVLLATDAAGEGINLQRAHLMVNYDLPWNPNRLEQRFGRIHRIGQTEVCHLWNLVAEGTREGDVYRRLLEKLEQARKSLGAKVFDVLGKLVFEGRPLRELLIDAIRYGDRPDVKAKLTTAVEQALDQREIQELLEEHALAKDAMDVSKVQKVREQMERAEARRLQPHYIESFFREAFARLGGSLRERESRRYQIKHVPAALRQRDRLIGLREPVLSNYERVVFDKSLIDVPGIPSAAFLCPGAPLLDTVLDKTLERDRDLLRRGAVLVDERDHGTDPKLLFYLEHAIQDAILVRGGERRVISKQLLYVELDSQGQARHLRYAPYLDYRPLAEGEPTVAAILERPECAWALDDMESQALGYAVAKVVPEHLKEVKTAKLDLISRTKAAVKERLTKEITYWDHRAEELKSQEQAGKSNTKLNSNEARKRADLLSARMKTRLHELDLEAQLAPMPPVILGGVLVIPAGLLMEMQGKAHSVSPASADLLARAARARAVIMQVERDLGFEPIDRELEKLGYDIESRAGEGKLRFLEVKGRESGSQTITVTKNEILMSLNKPEQFILAIVEFTSPTEHKVHYVRRPFTREPDFGVTSVNYDMAELVAKSEAPS